MNERLNVLVVDDEAPARDELTFLLQQQDAVGRVTQATGATSCLELLARGEFDAVFLDVRMPHLDGLELARLIGQMARPPQVVFVTAYEDHAVEAFGLAATDYLLKPVRPERLGVTLGRLTRARARAAAEAAPASASPLGDRIAVSARGRIRLLPAAEVLVAIADGEGVTVRTVDGRYHVRQTLHELEERLERHGFLRVHRAYLVNLNHVSGIDSFFNGTYLLKLAGLPDLTVPVSRRHAADLRAAIRL
ncbi:MAG TPA: LytTR family DNA-binding domain-containing protein [Candidatus Dormibacteraeota bacterium]|nr:LytTR family DNA-binding domain-containing protein [Candidatus Dormibacteraeota bacterium]